MTSSGSCSCEPQRIVGGCPICADIVTGYDPHYMLRGAYFAHLSGYDGAEDAGFQPVGYGDTREAAIADLHEIIEGHAG